MQTIACFSKVEVLSLMLIDDINESAAYYRRADNGSDPFA